VSNHDAIQTGTNTAAVRAQRGRSPKCYHGRYVDVTSSPEPESRHRVCWYGRRAPGIPPEVSFQTVEDGELLYCCHPMLFPVVGYHFDVRNCGSCDWFKVKKAKS
jgi:hypothetical protein